MMGLRERERERERVEFSFGVKNILWAYNIFSLIDGVCPPIKKFFSHHRCCKTRKNIFSLYSKTNKTLFSRKKKRRFNYIFSPQHLAYVSK